MERRGQAAMEFLMTYGWAILAAIIVIGVLAYFGVFSPSKLVPEVCTINSPLGLSPGDCQVSAAGGITLALRNGAGEQITVSSIAVTNCGTATPNQAVNYGAKPQLTVACTPLLLSGAKFSGDITVTYKRAGGEFDQTSTGRVSGNVGA